MPCFLNGGYLHRAGGLAAELDLQGARDPSRRAIVRALYDKVRRMSPEDRAKFVVGAQKIWNDLPEEQRRRIQIMEQMQPTDPRGLSDAPPGLGWAQAVGSIAVAVAQVGGTVYMAREQKKAMEKERKEARREAERQRKHEEDLYKMEIAAINQSAGAPEGAQIAQGGSGVRKAGGGLTTVGGGMSTNTMLIAGGIVLVGGFMMMMMLGGKKAA